MALRRVRGETTVLRDARFVSAHLAALCGERQVETLTSNAAQVAGLGRISFLGVSQECRFSHLKESPALNKHLIAVAATALVIVAPLVPAEDGHASAEARKLTIALANLRKNPNDTTAQQAYLQAFPKTYASFLHLFGYPGGEMYDGSHEYMDVLPSLAVNHERGLGQLLIQLSKDAHYEADAPGDLQETTAKYASQHTKVFIELVKQLSIEKRAHLITFLADGVEDFSAYPEYQETIDLLNSLGEKCLAEEFQVAREQREHQVPQH